MPAYRVSEAARLLNVSDDTVRRWIDAGRLVAVPVEDGRIAAGRISVDGAELARFAVEHAVGFEVSPGPIVAASARNRFTGLVTRVVKDTVMAQVEIQAGPFRVVSLMSSEAATELGLEPGVLAVAMVKATNVIVELPG